MAHVLGFEDIPSAISTLCPAGHVLRHETGKERGRSAPLSSVELETEWTTNAAFLALSCASQQYLTISTKSQQNSS